MQTSDNVNKDDFYTLLKQSTIVQGLIALIIVSATCYELINNHKVDDQLWYLCLGVLAFYIGGKFQDIRLSVVKQDGDNAKSPTI